MEVVFLDIDGVLNSNDWVDTKRFTEKSARYGYPDSHLDDKAIGRINHLCHVTGAKIVISSTWRSMDSVVEVLQRNGLKADVIGITPNLDKQLSSGVWTSKIRGEEIQAWLDENECDSYIIIDDDSDMLDSQKHRFIQTNPLHGFKNTDLNEAISLLNEPVMP